MHQQALVDHILPGSLKPYVSFGNLELRLIEVFTVQYFSAFDCAGVNHFGLLILLDEITAEDAVN